MKKIMISLMMVVAVTTTSFAKSNNTDVANAGQNVVENKYKAFRLFLKAANNGFPDAIFWVGECYNLGWGRTK